MHINTCIMWLSMNAVSADKNHLQMHLVRGYDETYLNCTCCVSTFCNSPSTTVTSESSSRNLLRLFKNVFNSKLKHETFFVLQTSTIYYNTVRAPLSNLGRNLYIRPAVRILQNVCSFFLHVAVKFPSSLAASFFYYSFAMWASFSEQSKSYFEPSTFVKLRCLLNLSTLSFFAYTFSFTIRTSEFSIDSFSSVIKAVFGTQLSCFDQATWSFVFFHRELWSFVVDQK